MDLRRDGQQPETICIRTTRMYDWCTKNGSTYLIFGDLSFPTDMARVAGVECDVLVLECAEVERRQLGNGVAAVTLRKQATLAFTFVDAEGMVLPAGADGQQGTRQTRTRFWDEFVRICAPETATVTSEVIECSCRTSLVPGDRPAVAVELFDCQTIESSVDVRVLVDTTDPGGPTVAETVTEPFTAPTFAG
jgi:hypothetical protein